jgi:hypothetical protein
MALHENCRYFGVETNSKEHCGQLERVLAKYPWRLGHCEGVEVDDSVKYVILMLSVHPLLEGS